MKDRVALVTGGTGGIGTAICQALCAAGFKVAAGYNKNANHEAAKVWKKAQKKAGFDITTTYADVSKYDECGIMIAEVMEVLGPIDILVNNAGITRDVTLRKMDPAQWQEVIATNLTSVFNTTSQVVNTMMNNGFGRVINISSINAQKGQFGQSNYAAAKAGMHGFTKSLAQEVAKKGITVNTISPGYIQTDMMSDVPEDVLAKIIAEIPVGRLGKPEEIARLVTFLADEKSGFITGADFSVNGGHYMA